MCFFLFKSFYFLFQLLFYVLKLLYLSFKLSYLVLTLNQISFKAISLFLQNSILFFKFSKLFTSFKDFLLHLFLDFFKLHRIKIRKPRRQNTGFLLCYAFLLSRCNSADPLNFFPFFLQRMILIKIIKPVLVDKLKSLEYLIIALLKIDRFFLL